MVLLCFKPCQFFHVVLSCNCAEDGENENLEGMECVSNTQPADMESPFDIVVHKNE